MRDDTALFRRQVGDDGQTCAMPVPTPCQCCGVLVATRPRRGSLRFPHRCPHGADCAAADPRVGAYLAGRGTCPDCNAARLAERRDGRS
jgi:hypothetical protein